MAPPLAPLQLDYQRTPAARRLTGLVLLLLGIAACLAVIDLGEDVDQQVSAGQRELTALRHSAAQRRVATAPATPAALPGSPAALRWEGLFTALEQAAGDDVTLLSLAPGTRDIVITGEARSIEAALDYAARLQQTPLLRDVFLARHDIVREHPQRPVRFTLRARWPEVAA